MLDSTTQARAVAAFTGVGILIRYSFYLIGGAVLGMIGLALLSMVKTQPKQIDLPPAFRLAAPELVSLSTRTQVLSSNDMGRIEARQYGQLYDRGRDMTVIMMMPPKNRSIVGDFSQEILRIPLLRSVQPLLKSDYYDLETRFGSIRAAEMRITADGHHKLCLAYLSRFDTQAVFLKGWICEGNGTKPSPDALACTLNRLVLDGPLTSADAEAFLRDRIARGSSSCWSTPVSQTTDTRPPRPSKRRY